MRPACRGHGEVIDDKLKVKNRKKEALIQDLSFVGSSDKDA